MRGASQRQNLFLKCFEARPLRPHTADRYADRTPNLSEILGHVHPVTVSRSVQTATSASRRVGKRPATAHHALLHALPRSVMRRHGAPGRLARSPDQSPGLPEMAPSFLVGIVIACLSIAVCMLDEGPDRGTVVSNKHRSRALRDRNKEEVHYEGTCSSTSRRSSS